MLIEKQSQVCPERASQGMPIAPLNHKMRERRRALGLTQKDLAILASVGINDVQAIERFADVRGGVRLVRSKLHRVAGVLELDFNELFPPDYLRTLEEWTVPARPRPFCWMPEVRLANLSSRDLRLALTDETMEHVEVEVDRSLLRGTVAALLNELTPRQRLVVEKRFGLDGEDAQTWEQIGCLLNVSRERIHQVEACAISRLRHPTRSKKLKPFRRIVCE